MFAIVETGGKQYKVKGKRYYKDRKVKCKCRRRSYFEQGYSSN